MRPWCKRPSIGAIRCCSDGRSDRIICYTPKINNKSQSLDAFATSRRLSVVGLGLLPLAGLEEEARMWKEEVGFYSRKIQNTFFNISGTDSARSSGKIYPKRALDAEFGMVLLNAMDKAALQRKDEYLDRCEALRQKELPYFQENGSCGHCGTVKGRAAFSDRDYMDFEAYIRGKALLGMAPKGSTKEGEGKSIYTDRDYYIENVRIVIGAAIMKHILEEVDFEDASAIGIAPGQALGKNDLLSASPELDSIRRGVKSVLNYFKRKGYMSRVGIAQFGLSKDEYENHMVWAEGEPAYLKYWLTDPVDKRSALALQSEEGASLGFTSATISAYLRRCGVLCTELKRMESLTDDNQVSEQWTLRRIKSLQNQGKSWEMQGYQTWKPDVCPGGSYDTDCY
eukprot:jgi/Picsp_1/859/NSC_04347-R1_hypothetical protein CHLNCDRAFT_49703 [Chlorella variabilis]